MPRFFIRLPAFCRGKGFAELGEGVADGGAVALVSELAEQEMLFLAELNICPRSRVLDDVPPGTVVRYLGRRHNRSVLSVPPESARRESFE